MNKEYKRITTNVIQEMKNSGEKISMLTAYDYTLAKIVDNAGIDVILVGDSASNVMAGHETTLPITLDNMIYHASSVVRAAKRSLVVVDLPFGSYQGDSKKALRSSIRIMKEAGAIKVVELNVSGAFHSPLMNTAKEVLSKKLLSIEIRNSEIPVYANVSASPISSGDDIRQALINQLEKPVLWHESVTCMIKDGITAAVEIGPGRVLQGLTRRIDRSLNMNGVESLEQIVNFSYV